MSAYSIIHSSAGISLPHSAAQGFEKSLLDRPALRSARLSSAQAQVDGLTGRFVEGATDWRLLASFTAGGLAYRAGRAGVVGLGTGNVVRAFSIGAGLSTEVSAFEFVHRGLSSVSVGAPGGAPLHENLWLWNGPGGLRQGILHSLVTFGTLKGAGRLAQSENMVVQHLFQDTAMVAGHQISGALEITPRPGGSLAEQFLEAETASLQLAAGAQLSHLGAPRLAAWQQGLAFSQNLNSRPLFPAPSHPRPQEAFATASASAGPASWEERPAQRLLSKSLGGGAEVPIVLGGFNSIHKILRKTVEKNLGRPLSETEPLPTLWKETFRRSELLTDEAKALAIEGIRQDLNFVANAKPESDFQTYHQSMSRLLFAARHWALYQQYGRERLFTANVLGLYHPLARQAQSFTGQYWYRAPEDGTPPPPTDYTPAAEALRTELAPQLARATQAMPKLKERGEFLAYRADEKLVNRLWIYQLLHFIESAGGRVHLREAECLVDSFNPHAPSLDSTPLLKALEALRREGLGPEAEQVIEWEVPYYEVMFGQQHTSLLKAPLSSLLRDIQYNLKGTVRLAEVGESTMTLRIPSPSLLQRLLEQVYGDQAPLLYYVNGEISRDEMMRLREKGISAVGIAWDPLILNDVQAWVPPWLFFFHDVFHAHSMAPYSPELRSFAAALYFHAVQSGLPSYENREEHFRRLVDLEARPEKYISFTLEHLHDIKWLADLNWRKKFEGLEDRIDFVEQYRQCIACFAPPDPAQALLKTQFQMELHRIHRKLERTQKIDRWLNLFGGKNRRQSP